MEKILRQLESFVTCGSDGRTYTVRGFEHLVHLENGVHESWESTGLAEYKLADGRHVAVGADGGMSVPALGLTLERIVGRAAAPDSKS